MGEFQVYIPSKKVAKEFEWPLRWLPGTSDSDYSTALPLLESEDDVRGDAAKVLDSLRGPFLVSATAAIHSLLNFQQDPLDE